MNSTHPNQNSILDLLNHMNEFQVRLTRMMNSTCSDQRNFLDSVTQLNGFLKKLTWMMNQTAQAMQLATTSTDPRTML